ncbi:MAG: hypothetical protein KF739_04695 [Cryobacterium sp.]|nr:hypothetical protein [Cryobacterium sp.]
METPTEFNTITIGGTKLDIPSGDVSAAHRDVMKAIENGGDWFTFSTEWGSYSIYVSPSTDVVVRYVNY